MSTYVRDRTIAGSVAPWSAQMWRPGETTDRWQDKRAHIALRPVGCFCLDFSGISHLAACGGNVRRRCKPLYVIALSHIAEARHAR
jgi:hypothetical protein